MPSSWSCFCWETWHWEWRISNYWRTAGRRWKWCCWWRCWWCWSPLGTRLNCWKKRLPSCWEMTVFAVKSRHLSIQRRINKLWKLYWALYLQLKGNIDNNTAHELAIDPTKNKERSYFLQVISKTSRKREKRWQLHESNQPFQSRLFSNVISSLLPGRLLCWLIKHLINYSCNA